MPTPAEPKPANPILSARIRKSFPPRSAGSLSMWSSAPRPDSPFLFGPSGSGKTTLLDCVAGLATPDAGRIAVGERVLLTRALACRVFRWRNGSVGYVLQDLALFPHLTVEQNIEYGLAHLPRRCATAAGRSDAARSSASNTCASSARRKSQGENVSAWL